MASYYYLTASLPMLRFDAAPPFTMEEFLASCRQNLSPRDYRLLVSVMAVDGSRTESRDEFVARWNRFLALLKNALHEQRMSRLGKSLEESRQHSEKDPQILEAVREAMQAEHPLDAELMLMRLQWDVAEQLSQSHVFDVECLMTYSLQLAILERKALFVPVEGNAEFKRLFSNLQSIIKSI